MTVFSCSLFSESIFFGIKCFHSTKVHIFQKQTTITEKKRNISPLLQYHSRIHETAQKMMKLKNPLPDNKIRGKQGVFDTKGKGWQVK